MKRTLEEQRRKWEDARAKYVVAASEMLGTTRAPTPELHPQPLLFFISETRSH